MTGTARIIRADSRHLPLADNTVDLVVTSPPYFGLRSYQDGGEHYTGQIGDEPTPREFIDALLEVTRECVRVLKPSGSMFVNLGDKYAVIPQKWRTESDSRSWSEANKTRSAVTSSSQGGIRPKSLMLIPERYRIACIDELGLIARAVIVWDKPNGLPESVTDRVRRSHEDWVHLTLQPRYYSAVDNVREPTTDYKASRPLPLSQRSNVLVPGNTPRSTEGMSQTSMQANPLGKLPGSVWTIPTQPLQVPAHLGVDHFAAFPMEWPRRIIRGWSPRDVCSACGEGRRPVGNREHIIEDTYPDAAVPGLNNRHLTEARGRRSVSVTIIGEACACPDTSAPTTPGVVLDPFGGTGTTALVAKAEGRHGISVDMSADYCRLAEWRTTDPAELARALQVDKPPTQLDGQLGMFGDGN